jgi:hypothetical protein
MITYPALFCSYCPLLFSAISIYIGFKSVITSAISFHYQKTSLQDVHSSNEQTHLVGDGHANMALVEYIYIYIYIYKK